LLAEEVHVLEPDRAQLLMLSTFPFPSDLDFDAGGGVDGGAIHANTTEYETSRLTLLNVCLIDVQGGVDEQCHSKVRLGSQIA
jgi:hypothetical protein